jgi:hypothetical protein
VRDHDRVVLLALATLLAARAVPAGAETTLRALPDVSVSRDAPPGVHVLWTIAPHTLSEPAYAVVGTLAYEGVLGTGYLEMWSHFPDGSRYFSRTLAQEGPMRALRGTSAARAFVLPFVRGAAAPPPTKLVVNAVLPKGGAITVRGVRLVAYDASEGLPGVAGSAVGHTWWGDRAAGLIGAVGGSLFGVVGVVLAFLVARGRARRFVMASLIVLLSLGAASLAAGFVALAQAQPYAVTFTLILLGALATLLSALQLHRARRRYLEIELRRMHAADAV